MSLVLLGPNFIYMPMWGLFGGYETMSGLVIEMRGYQF